VPSRLTVTPEEIKSLYAHFVSLKDEDSSENEISMAYVVPNCCFRWFSLAGASFQT
jgi:hypothetical protein